MHGRTAFLLLAPLLLSLVGCAGRGALTEGQRSALAAMSYPREAERGADLDIEVVREGGQVRLLNRTARPYEQVHLWLNQQYVAKVQRIAIGTGNRFALNRFVNRHGEGFPTAEFLAPDEARPVVSAELYDPEAEMRHRLDVRMEEGWERVR